MPRSSKYVAALTIAAFSAIAAYSAFGFFDALRDAPALKTRAQALIADGAGADALGDDGLRILLAVEDPRFYDHHGVDLSTPGAGLTTITQALSKRLAFKAFKPGLGKIRQSAYAIGLERRLSKEEILALSLDLISMGEGPDGWVTGFFRASEAFFGKAPSELSEAEIIELVSVMIAPGRLNPLIRGDEFEERVRRITRLVAGECAPTRHDDVWLEACAASSD